MAWKQFVLQEHWNYIDRPSSFDKFHIRTNALFCTFLLGIQRLEDEGKIPLAHQAMIEDMLTFWTAFDSSRIEWDTLSQAISWGQKNTSVYAYGEY